jgi:hypothetical protein
VFTYEKNLTHRNLQLDHHPVADLVLLEHIEDYGHHAPHCHDSDPAEQDYSAYDDHDALHHLLSNVHQSLH